MPIKTNIEDFCKRLEFLSDIIRCDQGLGDDIERVFGDRMVARTREEMGPDGSYWPENEPAYSARKGGLPVGILTGDMLAEQNVRGNVTSGDKFVHMSYAGSDFAKAKLGWFGATGRVVWGLDDAMREGFREAVRDHMRARISGRY